MNTVRWFKHEIHSPQYAQLRIREDKWSSSGWQVWPSAWFLSKFLERSVELDHLTIKGTRIVELGAGCGLPSIVAAHLGASVVATDSDESMACTEMNVSTSKFKKNNNGEFESLPLEVNKVEWGTDIRNMYNHDSFDFIMGSDLLSSKESYESLLLTLLQLSGKNSSCLLSHVWRREEIENTFFDLASEFFDIHETATEAEIAAYVKQQTELLETLEVDRTRRGSSIAISDVSQKPKHENDDGEIVIFELRLKEIWTLNMNKLDEKIDMMLKNICLRDVKVDNFGVDLISKFDANKLQISQTSTTGDLGLSM